MPIGVIINASVVVIGGIAGAMAGDKISDSFKDNLNTVFGACAMAMGIGSIVLMENMPALIFACTLGIVVSLIALPQFFIFMALYLLAGVIYPLCTPAMINDFKACGGILLLATGFRMIKVKEFPVADMIPAMVLAMPVSYLWTSFIMPLMG